MRLSSIPTSEGSAGYDLAHCAVYQCTRESEIVDASGARWDMDVPLCTQHWAQICETKTTMKTKETVREQVKADDKRERPSLVPGLRALQERMAKRMAKSPG